MDRSFNISKSPIACTLFFACISAMPLQSQAAPGVLPTAPLFLATGVEPNLFFTLDNSGSMGKGTTMSQRWIGGLEVNSNSDAYHPDYPSERKRKLDIRDMYQGKDKNNNGKIDPEETRIHQMFPPANGTDPEWDKFWVARSVDSNPMYYDPAVTYLPWPGDKDDGTPMFPDNIDPTDMQADQSSGSRYDLTAEHTFTWDGQTTTTHYFPTYFNWTDTNADPALSGNGIVDVTDTHQRVKIPASETEKMKNFANWYKYHRMRLQSMKYVVGKTIVDAGRVRMGINFYNGDRKTGVPIFEEAGSMQDAASQRRLLDTLYNVKTVNFTPSLSALTTTGEYFSKTDGSGPIVSKAEGGECQQNYNILMTDGVWDAEPSIEPGNADGDNDTDFDGGTYGDAFENTVADVAMKYYENDLRPDLDDNVPTLAGVDEAPHQHLVNYVVSFGVFGTLDPLTDDPAAPGFPGWPDPYSKGERKIDDLWHTAYNSRGKYFSAQGAEGLLASFNDIYEDFASRTSSASAVSVNTSELKANSFVYQAKFDSDNWTGKLLALEIIDLESGRLALEKDAAWDAGELLTARAADNREIITYHPGDAESVKFDWDFIDTDLQLDLRNNALGNRVNGNPGEIAAQARLAYLRGDRSNEGPGSSNFRERDSLLGSIVNSGPVYVGPPDLNWPDIAPFPNGLNAYSTFKAAQAGRGPVVYVGSNSGMLHAFKANDIDPTSTGNGREIFAYLPGMLAAEGVGQGLHYLTQTDYQHRFQVDLGATVSDAFVSMGGEGTERWRTVLVGGLRGGGRGLFALDVTSPTTLTETNADLAALWEFTAEDDADLGYTYSQPVVALTNAGTWVAIFGNGYNNDGDGRPHLFIVNLSRGGDGEWVQGTGSDDDYIKIRAGNGNSSKTNGLASPTLADVDGNGTVDRVYAGDLRGNLWAFDLSSVDEADWGLAEDAGGNAGPLFVTPGGENTPLTAKPVLARHPSQPNSDDNGPNLMVYFGTGQFLVNDDIDTTGVQTFYGIWDKGEIEVAASDLVEQSFDANFAPNLVLTRNPVDYDNKDGWFFDLAESGERSVTSPLVRGDIVFFNSYVPGTEPCESQGFGFRYAVDMATGGSPLRAPFDTNSNNKVDANDLVKGTNGDAGAVTTIRQDGFLPDPVVVDDLLYAGTEAITIEELGDIPTGRLSWQELTQ